MGSLDEPQGKERVRTGVLTPVVRDVLRHGGRDFLRADVRVECEDHVALRVDRQQDIFRAPAGDRRLCRWRAAARLGLALALQCVHERLCSLLDLRGRQQPCRAAHWASTAHLASPTVLLRICFNRLSEQTGPLDYNMVVWRTAKH